MKTLRKVELDGRYAPGKNVGQSHHDVRAKLCGHYCSICRKSCGDHGAEFTVNFRATVLSVILCLLALKNHFLDARTVLRCSEPDLLSILRDLRFRL